MQNLSPQRHLFDLPRDVAYFNMAYNSPQLNESKRRLIAAAGGKSHPWNRKVDDFFRDADHLRQLASEALGGNADCYAIIPAASYGAATAARLIEAQLQPGETILVIGEEFPSNYFAWQRIATEKGARLLTIPTPEDGNWTALIVEKIKPGVAAVVTSHGHWTNGAFIDLEKIGAACRQVGAALMVDATQSWGAMPLELAKIQPDFVYAGGYKWLLFPYGVGLLYVAQKWHEGRPLEESWLGRDNARDFARLANYSDHYLPGAQRFDMGEKCQALLPGAVAALEQIKYWGVANIATALANINKKVAALLEGLGFQLPPPQFRCPHMFGARIPSHYNGNLVAALAEQKIYVSQRANSVRFSPHLYIDDEDMARLETGLKKFLPAQ